MGRTHVVEMGTRVHKHALEKLPIPKARDGKRFWLKLRVYEDRGKRSKGNTMAPDQGCS